MKKRKRGIISEPMLAVLAVICLLALSSVFYGYVKYVKEGKDFSKCKASVLLSDKVRTGELMNVRTGERIGIDCPKKRIEIDWGDVKPKGGLSSQQRIKYLLAEEMRKCWEKMGGPEKYRPFDDAWFQTSDKFCVACADITFDDKVKKRTPEIISFNRFLVETDIGNRDYTYYKLFTESDFDGDPALIADGASVINPETGEMEGTINDRISTQEEYMVIYAITKKGLWKRLAEAAGLGTIGTGVGVLAGWGTVAVLTIIPIPGSRVAAFSLAAAMVVGGAAAGTYAGLVWGSQGIDYNWEVRLFRQELVADDDFGCEYLYT